jgi:hypothetical protein
MVVWIPEQLSITTMRHDVVSQRGRYYTTVVLILCAQRMLSQPRLRISAPAIVIEASRRGIGP